MKIEVKKFKTLWVFILAIALHCFSSAQAAAPTVSTFSPVDNGTDIAIDTNLVITFSEAVYTMTGDITIKLLSDDSVFETIPVGDARVTGNGTTAITINPVNGMVASAAYYVNIDATAFDNAASESYAGISNNGTWNFTTGELDATAWYNGDWLSRVRITIDAAKVNGDLTNFPVYVDLDDLPDDFFDDVNGSGADIRITNSTGLTELAREIVSISTTGNTGEMHFKAGSLSGTTNGNFYIYYNNSAVSEPAANATYGSENVWDSNYVVVLHLEEDGNTTAGGYVDSTSYDNDATGVNMTTSSDVALQLGKGQNFDGSSNSLSILDSESLDIANAITISAWADMDTAGSYTTILMRASWWYGLSFNASEKQHKLYLTPVNNTWSEDSNSTATLDLSTYFVGTWDGSTIVHYLDGSSTSSFADTGTINTGVGIVYIAKRHDGYFFDGVIDEVRLSNIGRSAAWVKTEYDNQNSPSTFYSVASSQPSTPDVFPPVILSLSPADNATLVAANSNLVIEFREATYTSTGNITIKKLSDNSTVQTIAIGDAAITGNGTVTLTINPNDLVAGTDYYINIAATALVDVTGNFYAGISDNGTWNFVTTCSPISGWYNCYWGKRIKLTVQASKVGGDLSNFPIYVDLSALPDSFFDDVDSNGADIRVTKTDGTTEVAREVVAISTTDNTGELYFVANGTLSGSSNSDWYLYYNNVAATEPSASATYGSQNVWNNGFVGVWHMQEDPNGDVSDAIQDSTSNANHGTPSGTMTTGDLVAGKLGKSIDFDGSNDQLTVADDPSLDVGAYISMSVWIHKDDAGSYDGIITRQTHPWHYHYLFSFNNNTLMPVLYSSGINTQWNDDATTAVTLNSWEAVDISFDGDYIYYYLNGAADGSINATNATVDDATAVVEIGNWAGYRYDGELDELRLSNVARSANWVSTSYNNQNGSSTFFAVGSAEVPDLTNPTVSTLSPADNATSVAVDTNLVITFSEAVYTMTGNITIKQLSDDSVFETIPVGDARVTGNGTTAITINPVNGMVASTAYYVNIAATAFDDATSNSYAGITDNGTWNFTTASVIVGWVNSNWASRLKLTIDATKVNGDVTDFPVYVDLSDLSSKNIFNNMRSDGGDIRVTQGDGLSLVPTELVSIDTTNNLGELWFKAPYLNSSTNTDFYIYYNNNNATTLNADHPLGKHAVWSNGFVAVYHMGNDPNGDVTGVVTNSVSNSLHGTPGGTMTSADKVAGQIGNGTDFDGTDDIFTAATTGISMDIGNISAWSKKDVANQDFGIWQIYTDGSDHLSVWVNATDDMWSLKLGGTDIVKATTAITDSNWHHVSVGYNFTSDNYELFQDGVSEASSTTNYTADTLAAEQDIGLDGTTNQYDGALDEIHIATKARTAAWINTEYNNQNSPSTFYTIGASVDDVNDDSTPKPISTYPKNNQDRFPLRANLTMTFNETVQAGSGNITIMKTSNGGTFDTIAIGSATFSSAQVTINPTSNLLPGTQYYVLIDSTAIEDASSNTFSGFADSSAWTFTTEDGNSTINNPANIFLFGE